MNPQQALTEASLPATKADRNTREIIEDSFLWVSLFVLAGLLTVTLVFDPIPQAAWLVFSVVAVAYAIIFAKKISCNPLSPIMLWLLVLLPLNYWTSLDKPASQPKLFGALLGIVIFFVLSSFTRTRVRLRLAAILLALIGIAFSLLAFFTLDPTGLPMIGGLFVRLQGLMQNLPALQEILQANANTIAGTLTFLLPFMLAMLFSPIHLHRKRRERLRSRHVRVMVEKTLYITSFLAMAAALLLTHSWGGLLGVGAGILAYLIWRDRKFAWILVILAVAALLIFIDSNQGKLTATLTTILIGQDDTKLLGRLDSWRAALAIVRDFPFTGGGLGSFKLLTQQIYTSSSFPQYATSYFHAHNNLLTTAAEMGLPALVLYAALLGCFAAMLFKARPSTESRVGGMLAGLGCGMLAHQVFGLTDAFMLGAKMGIFMWIFFGLAAGIYMHRLTQRRSKSRRSEASQQSLLRPGYQPREFAILLFAPLLIVILSSAVVTTLPWLAVVIAVVLGLSLGAGSLLLAGKIRVADSNSEKEKLAESR